MSDFTLNLIIKGGLKAKVSSVSITDEGLALSNGMMIKWSQIQEYEVGRGILYTKDSCTIKPQSKLFTTSNTIIDYRDALQHAINAYNGRVVMDKQIKLSFERQLSRAHFQRIFGLATFICGLCMGWFIYVSSAWQAPLSYLQSLIVCCLGVFFITQGAEALKKVTKLKAESSVYENDI